MPGTPRPPTLRGRRSLLASAGFVFAALVVSSCAATGPDPAVFWSDHDDANPASIRHDLWQEILDARLVTDDPSGVHLFDYGGLQASPGDRSRLRGYLSHLESIDPRRYSRDEQMAYWINFYNALTVEVVVSEYPVDSIRNIHQGIVPLSGPWGDVRAAVAGQGLTLDNIEHDILRALWRDPRIHYAVNCASLGCPNLLPTVFRAETLEPMLEAAARGYINHPRGVDVRGPTSAVASSIYDWFQEDFGGTEAGVRDHLLRYAEPDLASRLAAFEGSFDYEYDWALNDTRE